MKPVNPWGPEPPKGSDRGPISPWPGAVAMLLATMLWGLFMARMIRAQTLFPLLMLLMATFMGYLIVIDVERERRARKRRNYREVPPPADFYSVWPTLPDTGSKRRGRHRS